MLSSLTPSIPINVEFGDSLQVKPKSLLFTRDDLKLTIEQVMDFNNLATNGYKIKEYFETQC